MSHTLSEKTFDIHYTNINNAIIQYFYNIEWCMRRGMLDGVNLLLDNIPPYIIPFVYYDVRSCKLIVLAYMLGQGFMVEKILNKLVYSHLIKYNPNLRKSKIS